MYKLSLNERNIITDEASLFINNDKKIKLIKGEKKNKKITFSEDLETNKTFFGLGFDIHQLVKGKTLYLGGIKIPFHSGLKGHSDGDVILHAVIDALLGALRKKDIGTYFPSNEKKFKNILKFDSFSVKKERRFLSIFFLLSKIILERSQGKYSITFLEL